MRPFVDAPEAPWSPQHEARLTVRDSTTGYISNVVAPSVRQTAWTSIASLPTYTAPSTSYCPGGATISVYSVFNTPVSC